VIEHRERWGAKCRCTLLPAVALLLSGCYVSTEYEIHPEGKVIQRASLVREWTGDGAELALKEGGSFSAADLTLEYFECSSGGMQKESGSGTWSSLDSDGTTSILIRFEDGCSATLWAGEAEARTVLWATQPGDDQALILR
jgi:hypothetical protein